LIREKIKLRSNEDIWKIRFKRVGTTCLSLFLLLLGWFGIAYLSVYENEIQTEFSKVNTLVGSWAGTFFVTIINYVIPWLLALITELEQWDFAHDRIKNEVWRTYLAGILNNVIYALIQSEVWANEAYIRSEPIASFADANSAKVRFNCKEDMVAVAFIKLVNLLSLKFYFSLFRNGLSDISTICTGISTKESLGNVSAETGNKNSKLQM